MADVIRSLADANGIVPGLRVSQPQQRVLNDLAVCRTAKLGGHIEECDQCSDKLIAYNSCDNRHCPKCQGRKRAEWLEARCRDLLPVSYFHVVFTIPADLAPLALQNKREIYQLLFRAAAETLKEIAAEPKFLGAEIGFIAILHTWGQTLVHHPHIHCLVPGGGLAPDGSRWVSSRDDFLVPVRVLSRKFRGKLLDGLRAAYRGGRLKLLGSQAKLARPDCFAELCSRVRNKEWVVDCRPPFGGPDLVLKYLARYTHRVAISNHRIVRIDEGTVSFRYKDYARGGIQRIMNLTKIEFLRRFLLHVMPNGFMRIRYYGFLANACRKKKLARCRELLCEQPDQSADDVEADDRAHTDITSDADPTSKRCRRCGKGNMRVIRAFGPQLGWHYEPPAPVELDSS